MKHVHALALAAAILAPAAATATETISLTVASSHPAVIPWVGMIKTHFMAETDRILAETGTYEIDWQEAFGGTLYKANATLASVEEGVTDVGWVFSFLEGAKLPLSQVATYTPFATNNPPVELEVMWDLFETNDAFRNEWEQYNLKVLGLTATDSYDVYTKTPIATLGELDGMKLSAPGVLGTWLRGTGANAVDGSLTTFYTDIQTGVSDGVLSLALGVLPTKIYEVAPYVTRVQMGTVFSGGIAINKDTWNELPEEVQEALLAAGESYSLAHGEDLMARQPVAMAKIIELGASQNPPVTLTELPAEERQKWVDSLPNLADEWADAAEARGLPARAFLKAYMDGLRSRGEEPARDWGQAE
jgi:TRAP-type C4-dicarboxylate transport system substrate-binding protein